MVFYVMRVKVVIILKPEVIGIAIRPPTAMNQNLKTMRLHGRPKHNKRYNMQYLH
jgi:hypothetical protein